MDLYESLEAEKTMTREALRSAVILSKMRFDEEVAPFVKGSYERLQSDLVQREIDRIVTASSAEVGADPGLVNERLQIVLADVIIPVSEPTKESLEDGVESMPPGKFSQDDIWQEDATTDVRDHAGVLEQEILYPDYSEIIPLYDGGLKHGCFRCGAQTEQIVCIDCNDELVKQAAGTFGDAHGDASPFPVPYDQNQEVGQVCPYCNTGPVDMMSGRCLNCGQTVAQDANQKYIPKANTSFLAKKSGDDDEDKPKSKHEELTDAAESPTDLANDATDPEYEEGDISPDDGVTPLEKDEQGNLYNPSTGWTPEHGHFNPLSLIDDLFYAITAADQTYDQAVKDPSVPPSELSQYNQDYKEGDTSPHGNALIKNAQGQLVDPVTGWTPPAGGGGAGADLLDDLWFAVKGNVTAADQTQAPGNATAPTTGFTGGQPSTADQIPQNQTMTQMNPNAPYMCNVCNRVGTFDEIQNHITTAQDAQHMMAKQQQHTMGQPQQGGQAQQPTANFRLGEAGDPNSGAYEDNVHKDEVVEEESPQNPLDHFNKVITEMANRAAARHFSQANDDIANKIASDYGLDPQQVKGSLFGVADFGNFHAANGVIGANEQTPAEYIPLGVAGSEDITGKHEAVVPVDTAVRKVADDLGMNTNNVYASLKDSYGDDLSDEFHTQVEGTYTYYLPRSLMDQATQSPHPETPEGQPDQSQGTPGPSQMGAMPGPGGPVAPVQPMQPPMSKFLNSDALLIKDAKIHEERMARRGYAKVQ